MEVFSGSDVSHQDCPKNSFFKFGIPTALAQTEGVDQPEQGDQKERRTRRYYPKCNGYYPTSNRYYPKTVSACVFFQVPVSDGQRSSYNSTKETLKNVTNYREEKKFKSK